MASAKRRADSTAPADAYEEPASAAGGWPGGDVGRMQADLALRLARSAPPVPVSPAERVVRLLSVGGGVAALLAGYAAAAVLIWR